MMSRLKVIALSVAVACVAAGRVCAQVRKDTVVLYGPGGGQGNTGRVLAETWKTVELDRDGDGRADVSYEAINVRRVEYAAQPPYMVDAILLRRRPTELIAKLSQAYSDNSTPKHILQHAYHEIATTHAHLARTDPARWQAAVAAYEKLFSVIPDTVYAVKGRIELGNLLLELGKGEEAIQQFAALADGRFGPDAARRSRLMMAHARLSLKQFDHAQKLLDDFAASGQVRDAELLGEVKLLRSRALIGREKLDEASSAVYNVLGGNPSERILGMAYCVLGDVFAARGEPRTALTAYLKVLLMYPGTDSVERAEALKQAHLLLEKMGRAEDRKLLEKQSGG